MALNTTPLSPLRRAVMLLLLALFFLGSLGFAQLLVLRRGPAPVTRGTIGDGAALSFQTNWPAGFTDDPQAAVEPPVTLWGARKGTTNGGRRDIVIISFPLGRQGRHPLSAYAGALVASNLRNPVIRTSAATLGGYEAIDMMAVSGTPSRTPRPGENVFARIRAAIVEGRFVGVLYVGESAWAPKDEANFETTAGPAFRIRVKPAASTATPTNGDNAA